MHFFKWFKEASKYEMAHVKWMTKPDIPEVLEVSALMGHPISKKELLSHQEKANVTGMVAEVDEKIVGWMSYDVQKMGKFPKQIATLEIIYFYPGEANRAGKALADKIKSKIIGDRVAAYHIIDRNMAGVRALQEQGFKSIKSIDPDTEISSQLGDVLGILVYPPNNKAADAVKLAINNKLELPEKEKEQSPESLGFEPYKQWRPGDDDGGGNVLS